MYVRTSMMSSSIYRKHSTAAQHITTQQPCTRYKAAKPVRACRPNGDNASQQTILREPACRASIQLAASKRTKTSKSARPTTNKIRTRRISWHLQVVINSLHLLSIVDFSVPFTRILLSSLWVSAAGDGSRGAPCTYHRITAWYRYAPV